MARFQVLVLVSMLIVLPLCYARPFYHVPLPPGVSGPETIAFDCLGKGPYVGVSDGRILRWEGLPSLAWTEFATMPIWSTSCLGVDGSPMERECGRPLGLKFHPKTCKLYVADAYHGLVVVPREGGRGKTIVSSAEGVSFKFMNALDINPRNGLVYFTDTNTKYDRLDFNKVIESGDNTGRFMAYNPMNKAVKVLMRGLRFANGVALSQNMDFVLVTETTTGRVHRFWLKGTRYHTSEVLLVLRGNPDNINRGPDGNFWIAQMQRSNDTSGFDGMPVKIDGEGRILERLDFASGEVVSRSSDVKEFGGRLWIGSVMNPFIEIA